jgi:hypothetical protein
MVKSVFLQVAEAIGDRVKVIDGTGNWQTNIGLKTQVGRFTFIKSELAARAWTALKKRIIRLVCAIAAQPRQIGSGCAGLYVLL